MKKVVEELLIKHRDNSYETGQEEAEAELLTRYADLQAYKADIENAIKGAMDDNPDEKHCSCVPLFKVKIKQLEEKVKTLAGENEEMKEVLDWLESIMLPDDNYCEIYLGGLRNFREGHATAFQIESQPEKFKTTQGKTLLEAINNAKNKR